MNCLDNLEEEVIKILIIGDSGTGKSSFIDRYIHEKFNDYYKPTLGVDFAIKRIKTHEGKHVKLQFWDIAGQDRFPLLTRSYYRYARGCLIVFDLTDVASFNNVKRWKSCIESNCDADSEVPCILVANKADLKEERRISYPEIEDMCNELNFVQWTETSVKTGLMLQETVQYLIDVILGNSPKFYTPSEYEVVDKKSIVDIAIETNVNTPSKTSCVFCS
ncbi:ras-related protein Rab-7L1-like isoform X2 [Physella acuta]|uniref:ras-related protein Rab-7L1-like isoform X2 n=1 Tax=Physella acuta TaxID=109671 RepID=UPI0027DE161D|nr:ras-related protein Rab-7L1-like isoform X2 [Physella acuta]